MIIIFNFLLNQNCILLFIVYLGVYYGLVHRVRAGFEILLWIRLAHFSTLYLLLCFQLSGNCRKYDTTIV